MVFLGRHVRQEEAVDVWHVLAVVDWHGLAVYYIIEAATTYAAIFESAAHWNRDLAGTHVTAHPHLW